jgi:hypothetical protein
MSDFIFLFRGGDKATPAEMQANMQKWIAWMDDMKKKGHFKGGQPLEDAGGKVITGKKKVVTDGPYAEAKDLVGGYMVVDARDLGQATEFAMGCPIYERNGTVEVRTVAVMPGMPRPA